VLAAIRARDAAAAHRAMLEHIEAVEGLVLGSEPGGRRGWPRA
jgi:DNA-binding GntR family transcriptional regulator